MKMEVKNWTITTYKGIPAMTPGFVHEYLTTIGKGWTGKGIAVELGSWLGGTAAPLMEGLEKAGYNRTFYMFDRWSATDEQVLKAKSQGVNLYVNENTMGICKKNLPEVSFGTHMTRGNLPGTLSRANIRQPIEICVFDAPKSNPVFSRCMEWAIQRAIPGVTIFGLLDYYFYKYAGSDREAKYRVQVEYMENNRRFELLQDWGGLCDCAFFKFIK